jgi:hypothetical protein
MIYCPCRVQPLLSRDGSEASSFLVRAATLVRGVGRRARTRIPELAFVIIGIALRVSLTRSFDVTLGYDFPAHLQYVRYLVEHHSLPPYQLNYSTYNPPLWYALAAVMVSAGITLQAIARVSIACSCLQLVLVWVGLEVYLRESRMARVLTLAIAAVVPASLHLAGFFSNHAFNDLLCTGGILLLPQVLVRPGRAAVRYGVGAGVCLGLALLTKISVATVLEAFLAALAIMIVRGGHAWRDTVRGLLPGAATVIAVVTVMAGWQFVRNKILYRKFAPIAFDMFEDIEPFYKIPYLDRRTFGFVGYWNTDIYAMPYWSSAIRPHSRFWPTLVATTFSDYFNFAFVPRPGPKTPTMSINGKPMRASALWPSRASVVGGTALALLAVAAWLVAARTLWRREDDGRILLLLVGLLAVVGQLHFSIQFPVDHHGVTKGAYLQFAASVYCALAGLAIATLWNRRGILSRLLALGGMAAIVLVAVYSVFAKVVVPLFG